MKTLILSIACVGALLVPAQPAIAADTIEVKSATEVVVNGNAAGTIVDALANGADRAKLLDAVMAWETATKEHIRREERMSLKQALEAQLATELNSGDGPKAQQLREIIATLTE